MKDITYDLRNQNLLTLPKANTVSFGTNSLVFRGHSVQHLSDPPPKIFTPPLPI